MDSFFEAAMFNNVSIHGWERFSKGVILQGLNNILCKFSQDDGISKELFVLLEDIRDELKESR